MANHKSTIKRIRQTKVRTERNKFYKTRIKNMTKDLLALVQNGDKAKSLEYLRIINKEFNKYASKGILKKLTASRKISRLHNLVNSLENK